MTEVTVIMATTGEETLEASLASLQQQTMNDFKIVLFNDGGNDLSLRLRKFSQLNIQLLQSEERLGLAHALNAAISCVESKYIARMDADDVCLPFRLDAQREYLEKWNFDLIGSSVIKKTGRGAIEYNISRNTMMNVGEALKFASPIPHPTFFGKSSIFKCLGYNRELPYSQDYDFLARASINGKNIGFMNTPTLIYNVNEKSNIHKHYQQMVIANRIARSYHDAINNNQKYQINSIFKNPGIFSAKLLKFRAFTLARRKSLMRIFLLFVYLLVCCFCREQYVFNKRIFKYKIKKFLSK